MLIWGLCSPAFLKSFGAGQRRPAPARPAVGQHSPVTALSHALHVQPRNTHSCCIPREPLAPGVSGLLLLPLGWGSAALWDVLPGWLGNGNPRQSKPYRAPPSRHCSAIRHLNPPGHREEADTRQSISVSHIPAKQTAPGIFCL